VIQPPERPSKRAYPRLMGWRELMRWKTNPRVILISTVVGIGLVMLMLLALAIVAQMTH